MAKTMNDDLRAYMTERGIRRHYQDRSVNELEILVRACPSTRQSRPAQPPNPTHSTLHSS